MRRDGSELESWRRRAAPLTGYKLSPRWPPARRVSFSPPRCQGGDYVCVEKRRNLEEPADSESVAASPPSAAFSFFAFMSGHS